MCIKSIACPWGGGVIHFCYFLTCVVLCTYMLQIGSFNFIITEGLSSDILISLSFKKCGTVVLLQTGRF